jgi:hypothetical protein
MNAITRWIIPAFAVLFAIPSIALPQGRWNNGDGNRNPGYSRIDSKAEAYRAGYSDGYREGMRRGRQDYLERRRFNNRVPETALFGGEFNFRFRNEARKGFKNGYKEGYRDSYQGHRFNRRY